MNLPKQLQSMSYLCPGLHGPGTRQEVYPCPLADLWAPGASPLVIPLFQRRYAWSERTVLRWFSDVVDCPDLTLSSGHVDADDIAFVNARQNIVHPDASHRHRVGKLVLKSLPDGSEFVIDGQQRITTALLFVTAVRDFALEYVACLETLSFLSFVSNLFLFQFFLSPFREGRRDDLLCCFFLA